jgi:hypothetical protein
MEEGIDLAYRTHGTEVTISDFHSEYKERKACLGEIGVDDRWYDTQRHAICRCELNPCDSE